MDNRAVTMPLAYAALNLHRRESHSSSTLSVASASANHPPLHAGLHQLLYEGYVQRSAGMSREHDALNSDEGKYETMFLFGEYFAWREQVRRQMHRNGNTDFVKKLRGVDQVCIHMMS